MDTTQNPMETPNDGESKLNQDTPQNSNAAGGESKQQENANQEEENQQKPYIPKPGENIELRKKF